MPAIYHEGSWLGNATDPEVLVKDTVGWTGKNLLNDDNAEAGRAWNGATNADRARLIVPVDPSTDYVLTMHGTNPMSFIGYTLSATTTPTASSLITIADFPMDISTGENDHYMIIGFAKTSVTKDNVKALKLMLRDSRIVDPTYEPYHESVEEEIEQIYADNGVLGAKNLTPNTSSSGTYNGVTFTANEDGSITVNGTATALAWRTVCSIKLPVGKYILNGCPAGGDTVPATYCIALWNSDGGTAGSIINVRDAGDGVVVDITQELTYSVNVGVAKGQTVNNLTFYPMLRLASDPDDTYQPYAMTNRELTEEKINIADLKTVVSASSDFADFKTKIASL